MLDRATDQLKQVLVLLVVAIIVIFLVYHLVTDPVGSAHVVSAIYHGAANAIGQIVTFVKAL